MLKSGFAYVVTGFLNALTPFILLPYLTSSLSVAEYGTLGFFMTIISLLPPLLGLSLNGAAFRKYFERNEVDSKYNTSCFLVFLINSLILFTIALLFSDKLSSLLQLPKKFIFLAMLASVNAFLITFFLSQMQALGRYKSYSMILLTHSGLNLFLTYFFISQLEWGLDGRIRAIIVAGLLTSIVILVWMSRAKIISVSLPKRAFVKDALKYSLPLIPHSFLSLLIVQSDKLLIQYTLGPYDLGVYMTAFQISLIAKVFYTSLNNAYSPWLMKHLSQGHNANHKQLVVMIYKFTAAQVILALVSYPLAIWMSALMIDKKFGSVGELAYGLVLVQILHGFYFVFSNFIFYSKKTSLLLIPTFLSGIVGIIFMIVSIGSMGVWGCVLGLVTSKLVLITLLIHRVNKLYDLPWNLRCRH